MRKAKRMGALILAMFIVLSTSIMPAFAVIVGEWDSVEAWEYYTKGTEPSSSKGQKTWESMKEAIVTHYISTIDESIITNKLSSSDFTTDGTEGAKENYTVHLGTYHFTTAGFNKLASLVKTQADSVKAKNGVASIGDQLNLTPDIEGAAGTLDGIRDIASTLVGILVIAVTIGMTLFTALDLCYITMPVFRNKCDDMKQSGQGAMVRTDNKSGEAKLRWVTDEAQYAVQQAVNSGTGKSPIMIYLGKRIGAFIAIGVVLFILFTGNISILINIVLNLISGLMNALAGFGS